MSDQTPSPEYVPRPSGSSSGPVLIVVAVLVMLFAACGVGLLGVGFLSYRSVRVQQPLPVQAAPPVEAPLESAAPDVAPSATPQPPGS